MNNIILYKQSVVEYSLKYGVTEAAKRYKQHRKTIYRWREKYDGTVKSLKNKSRRPHSHPKQHTKEEIDKIKRYKSHNSDEALVVLWIKLVKTGYTRSITRLYRVMQRLGIYKKAPSKKKEYIAKSYEQKTPRHNGKVERSHRKDQERFYYKRVFVDFEDFKEKLRHWAREYNNFPMKLLG